MTIPHVHATLIKLWADGAKVEREVSHNAWIPCPYPTWKPEDRYRLQGGTPTIFSERAALVKDHGPLGKYIPPMEKSAEFKRQYLKCKNEPGSSVGPQRRTRIKTALYEAKGGGSFTMFDTMYLERYFNELWGLCPYGLEKSMPAPASAPVPTVPCPVLASTVKDDFIMNNATQAVSVAAVSNITYVYGVPSKDVTDDTIFRFIAKLEGEIRELEKIANKPKKLGALIEALHAEIKALVELVDSRD